jgi:hypothetical protein
MILTFLVPDVGGRASPTRRQSESAGSSNGLSDGRLVEQLPERAGLLPQNELDGLYEQSSIRKVRAGSLVALPRERDGLREQSTLSVSTHCTCTFVGREGMSVPRSFFFRIDFECFASGCFERLEFVKVGNLACFIGRESKAIRRAERSRIDTKMPTMMMEATTGTVA